MKWIGIRRISVRWLQCILWSLKVRACIEYAGNEDLNKNCVYYVL